MSNYQIFIALLLVLLTGNAAFGQVNSSYAGDNSIGELAVLPKYAVGFSQSALLNKYPMLQFTQEFGLTSNVGIILDYGFSPVRYNTIDPNGRRIKLGGSFITQRRKSVYTTINASYLSRSTSETVFVFDSWEDRLETQHTHLQAVEGSISVHKVFASRVKLELGVGVVAGYTKLISLNEPAIFDDVGSIVTGISDEVWEARENGSPVSKQYLSPSFDINVSYILFK